MKFVFSSLASAVGILSIGCASAVESSDTMSKDMPKNRIRFGTLECKDLTAQQYIFRWESFSWEPSRASPTVSKAAEKLSQVPCMTEVGCLLRSGKVLVNEHNPRDQFWRHVGALGSADSAEAALFDGRLGELFVVRLQGATPVCRVGKKDARHFIRILPPNHDRIRAPGKIPVLASPPPTILPTETTQDEKIGKVS